jgi:hypothetical protein
VDFIIREYLVIAVDGIYWHFRTTEQRVKNELDRATVEGLGYLYIQVLDVDMVERTDTAMRAALLGQELPGARLGLAGAA